MPNKKEKKELPLWALILLIPVGILAITLIQGIISYILLILIPIIILYLIFSDR